MDNNTQLEKALRHLEYEKIEGYSGEKRRKESRVDKGKRDRSTEVTSLRLLKEYKLLGMYEFQIDPF